MLRALLDEVIPPSPDGRLPGAGGLGLIAHVARTVQQTPMLRPVVEYGFGDRGAGGQPASGRLGGALPGPSAASCS